MPQNPLAELIAARIAKSGPLSVAEYMELALTHPEYGYYTNKDPLGAAGDFTTAPEISQIFGELIGLWLAEQWHAMKQPKVVLIELGPGRGTLMSDILRTTKKIPGFHDAVSVHLVEASPLLQQKQWQTLAGQHPHIHWHRHFSDIPEEPLLLVANEFFDALPVRQFVDGEERKVGVDGERLTWIPASAGMIKETCELAETITADMASRIATHGGAALIIDYGYEQGHGDTLQAVRNHRYHDPLVEPGTADLTAHVDFGALKKAAAGATTHGPVSQGAFLNTLGAGLRAAHLGKNATEEQKAALIVALDRLTSPQHMGELFKVLAITPLNYAKPEGF